MPLHGGPIGRSVGGRLGRKRPARRALPPPRRGAKCCDALRCSGPHARYTDGASEFSLGRKAWLALITSLPFVHTARRYYRLNGSVRRPDWPREVGNYHSGPESSPNSVI
ncbi:hypothetical protein Trco_006531 [Trichoderma cornu-damae]|uniref:Uncharacterized protein n=1 Tax=Trichoderma cornu-damae TaxID=654480 RepID=A0A9P8TV40_9HYPO|nr:hypothetical protein Trco_006531 [Trichoderma cornu-damae]